VNTIGFQGPIPRYTPEEAQRFMEEEERRNAEETAAYYAWKRGDTPLGTPPPTYTPPDPDTSTTAKDSETKKLFDEDGGEGGNFRLGEKVDIESVDVDDLSPKGRARRMKAMATELEGFSNAQRREAERAENERMRDDLREGRKITDLFGQRFDEAPPKK
jgi:hypothetical protein